MTDYIYDNAPVVEVLAELRWELTAVQNAGIFIDSNYEACEQAFIALAGQSGYGVTQRMVPPSVPRELLSYNPIIRIREENDTWPLFQLGPGIFTANMVPTPGYDGWRTFNNTVRQGLGWLYESYPASNRLLKITSLQLTYVNAIRSVHGNPADYALLSQGLGIAPGIPEELAILTNNRGADTKIVSEIHIPIVDPAQFEVIIRFGPGKHNSEDAVVFQNTAAFNAENSSIMTIDQVMAAFDSGHGLTRKVFESVLEANLGSTFGTKTLFD